MQLFRIIFLVVAASVLLMNSVFSQQNTPASDYPTFKDGKLTIPRIDTEEQTGNYFIHLPVTRQHQGRRSYPNVVVS